MKTYADPTVSLSSLLSVPNRRRALAQVAALLWAAAAGRAGGAEDTAPVLKLGLGPFFAPAAMLRVFRRIREHLAQSLGRPVETFTARDLRAFADKVREHEYDVALIPAHLARLAILEWGYVPLASTLPRTMVQLLVRNDSKANSPADLRGSRIGGPDRLSTIWLSTAAWLDAQGLVIDRDYEFVLQPSGNSALYSLDRGDIQATSVVSSQLRDMPPETPRNYRVFWDIGTMMSPVYIARATLPPAVLEQVRAALLSFTPDPALPTTSSNVRLSPLTLKDLDSLDAEMQAGKRILLAPP